MATISVAMTTYNGERFLGEQLRSIAAQERLPDELVIAGLLDKEIHNVGRQRRGQRRTRALEKQEGRPEEAEHNT